ncbi:MAG: sensor domain-containing protein [Bacillota bacterium]
MTRRGLLAAAIGIMALFIALLVAAGQWADHRIEQHRTAQVQLERLGRLLPALENLERRLVAVDESVGLVEGSADGLLDAAENILAAWRQTQPLGDRTVVAQVSEAGDRYASAYRQLLLLYSSGGFEEARTWWGGEVRPALSSLRVELGAARSAMEAAAEHARWQRTTLDVTGGLVGMLVFIIVLWQLEKARVRTEQLEQAQRLRENRDRHIEAILSNMENGILILDAGGRIQQMSPGVERLFGYTATEAMDRRVNEVLHPDDLDIHRYMLAEVAATHGAEFRGEVRVQHADGTYRYAEVVSTNLLQDPDIQGILVQAHDITARKQAEEALRESETRLRATLRQLPAMLYLVDRDLRILEASGAMINALGFAPEAIAGRSLTEFLALAEQGAEVMEIYRQVLSGASLEWEGRFLGRTFRAYGEPFRNQEGEVAGVLTIALDITESVQAQAELREQERLHRLITENAIEVVSLYTYDGATTYCSPASQALLGYSPQEYMAATVEELVHPDDLDAVWAFRRRSLAGQPGELAYRMKKRDGQYVWFETITRALRGENGELLGCVASSRDITERRRFEEQLAYMAYHDQQTGLPNRAALVERLAEQLDRADGTRIGVTYLQLTRLNVINESLGLEAGDLALKESARRLRERLPEHLVARCGGSEFAILLELPDGSGLPHDYCELVYTLFEAPVSIGFREVQLNCSLGLSMGHAGEITPDELIRQANTALHHAKARGARYALFHPSMSTGAMERLELDGDLRRAIRQGELQVYYQPIVDLKSEAFIGVEALVRWHHPVRGWIPPSQFIPLAEQTGFIDQVGRWVLEQACLEGKRLLESGVSPERFFVSVNLSPVQFRRVQVVEEIAAVLADTGLPARHLTLELTESTLMANPSAARAMLQRLKALGIQIAIDDFGTGHSSLSYLKKFPVDILKIDRSFVSGLGESLVDRELARTVVGLARALGLKVTAEGVESPEQVAELQEIGCDKAQGYFFARPVPPDKILEVLTGAPMPGVQ